MKQLTINVLYGQKDKELRNVISECQEIISGISKNNSFRPYLEGQIHATLISLERFRDTKFNLNLVNYRNQYREMDFEGVINFIRSYEYIPFMVQFGGFNEDYIPFYSRQETPYKRSFQIVEDKAVMIGWPIKNNDSLWNKQEATYPNILDDFRRDFQKYNVLHAYHRDSNDIDNDFYFRVGIVDIDSVENNNAIRVEKEVRNYLQSISPLIINVKLEDIFLACYEDNQLPISTTRTWRFTDDVIKAEFMWSLLNDID